MATCHFEDEPGVKADQLLDEALPALPSARLTDPMTEADVAGSHYAMVRRYLPKCGTVNAIRPRSPE